MNFRGDLSHLLNQPDVDVWFADESGFEGDPYPRKRWDKKGRRTQVTKNAGCPHRCWTPRFLIRSSPGLVPLHNMPWPDT